MILNYKIKEETMANYKAKIFSFALAVLLTGMFALSAQATPVVKTVPWVAATPLVPHDTYPGAVITLKGTVDPASAGFNYVWDFGDGTLPDAGIVGDPYAVEATHTYDLTSGPYGTVFTAKLTVTDPNDPTVTATKNYYIKLQAQALNIEVNVAIDEGLWYLHKSQRRDTPGFGPWNNGWPVGSGWQANHAININAFEVNGHYESGSADNPYTETVARGLKTLFSELTTYAISPQTNFLSPTVPFNPDLNGNGFGIYPAWGYPFYQSGMIMDAIIASGTPNAVTTSGPAGIINRTYREIVEDYAELLYFGQYDGGSVAYDINGNITSAWGGGGWRYDVDQWPDNSPSQWVAIGLIPWQRVWGGTVPPIVKDSNKVWLAYSQDPNNGLFGYDSPGYYPWGPWALTPSGMVQMAMDGVGRNNAGLPSWNKAETVVADNFCNGGGAYYAVRDYYYGLFSLTKSMLLHDSNGDGIAEPITTLQSLSDSANNIDWYGAEVSKGAKCDGVARKLVDDQVKGPGAGYWWCHEMSNDQCYFETAQAIIMLNKTVYQSVPVAVGTATPNPALANWPVTLSGSQSYHQDAGKQIVKWEWDFESDGFYDAVGVTAQKAWPVLNTYPVTLRVTDNLGATATTIVYVDVKLPPVPPTADAGGPYVFCPAQIPWFLDGSRSVNPDNGAHEGGAPPDQLTAYDWDLNGDGNFNEASGVRPDVTAFFSSAGVGDHLIQLKVLDNTALSFPSTGMSNLPGVASSIVSVKAATDPACSCITNLVARAKPGQAQLQWAPTPVPGWDHYNVYRSTQQGGPYALVGSTTSTYAAYLDQPIVNGTKYYYVVRQALANGNEVCQSGEVSVTPKGTR
jgi:hypothetical protein